MSSSSLEEETVQTSLVLINLRRLMCQATGIMAESFHIKTASDNNTLKIPRRFDT